MSLKDRQGYKTLMQMGAEVALWTMDKQWRPDPDRTVLEEMMLIVTEAAEAVEAWREDGMRETLQYTLQVGTHGTEKVYWNTELPEPQVQAGNVAVPVSLWAQQMKVVPKPLGVASEAADIFIRLLDLCEAWDIDLEDEYEKKMAYNRTRAVRHGGKKA